jgi:hypothetical protein
MIRLETGLKTQGNTSTCCTYLLFVLSDALALAHYTNILKRVETASVSHAVRSFTFTDLPCENLDTPVLAEAMVRTEREE